MTQDYSEDNLLNLIRELVAKAAIAEKWKVFVDDPELLSELMGGIQTLPDAQQYQLLSSLVHGFVKNGASLGYQLAVTPLLALWQTQAALVVANRKKVEQSTASVIKRPGPTTGQKLQLVKQVATILTQDPTDKVALRAAAYLQSTLADGFLERPELLFRSSMIEFLGIPGNADACFGEKGKQKIVRGILAEAEKDHNYDRDREEALLSWALQSADDPKDIIKAAKLRFWMAAAITQADDNRCCSFEDEIINGIFVIKPQLAPEYKDQILAAALHEEEEVRGTVVFGEWTDLLAIAISQGTKDQLITMIGREMENTNSVNGKVLENILSLQKETAPQALIERGGDYIINAIPRIGIDQEPLKQLQLREPLARWVERNVDPEQRVGFSEQWEGYKTRVLARNAQKERNSTVGKLSGVLLKLAI